MSSPPSRQLLVTGASGFLGSAIVDLALHAGWSVRALYRNSGMTCERAEPFIGDMCDTAILRRASDGVSAIIHAAGRAHVFGQDAGDSVEFNRVNEVGTAKLTEVAVECGVPRIVLVSSVSVYGRYSGPKCDETAPCQPQGSYAISKWRGELSAIERAAAGRCRLTILRFATIYGEHDRGNVARLIAAIDGGHFIWPGSGKNRKSLIYRDDAARACLRVLDRSGCGLEIFNITAQPSTMNEIVTAICHALGRPIPRIRIPETLVKPAGAILRKIGDPGQLARRLEKFTQDDVYDGTKFEAAFGFRPSVPLREGIRREVEFLHAYGQR